MLPHSNCHTCEDTFKSVFHAYKNRLYGYVLALSHSEYTAEEITQEIFLKLWICRDGLNDIDNIEGYLFSMARNKTLNYLSKAASQEKLLKEIQASMKPVVSDTENKVSTAELDHLLQQALAHLSPQRRLVYQLSRTQGLNHEQIAVQLRLSRNTVKNHLVSALHFIRDYMTRHGAISLLLFMLLHG